MQGTFRFDNIYSKRMYLCKNGIYVLHMIDWVIHWVILHFRIYECLDIFQGSSIDLPTLLNSFGPFVALSDRLVPRLVGDSAASAILASALVDESVDGGPAGML